MSDDRTEAEHAAMMKQLQAEQQAKQATKTIKRGITLVHTGDGKGKSTAAFGMAIRALGHGQRVGIVQFFKGKWTTGEELFFAQQDGVDHFTTGDGFTWDTQDRAADIATVREGWELAMRMVDSSRGDDPHYQLIILDELNIALAHGYFPVEEVVALVQGKPEALSLVITGRGAPPELMAVADTVSEMLEIKHAYADGVLAQKGVDF